MQLAAAYSVCEEITRKEAKNFSYGIRLLPHERRQALSAVYALARRIDDIGDSYGPPAERLEALARVRGDIASLESHPEDPVLLAVSDAARRYLLPMSAFEELIQGCEQDVRGASYNSLEDLVCYCRLVAGSIGRLSLAVFGTTATPKALRRADALGVGLQLTNILRDVLEDKMMGRVYLPAEDAEKVGCPPDLSGPAHVLAALVAYECPRVREFLEEGLGLLPLLEPRSRACTAAMAGIYERLLCRIERDPMAVTISRVSIPFQEKLWVVLRSLAGSI